MNTVVWVSGALRADHVGCYGARRVRTPTIDALAAAGVRFDQCIAAAPRTSLAATSIATGRYPHRHGVLDWGSDPAPGTETVQGRFAREGYEVASFVFDEGFLFRNMPDAMVRGRSDSIDPILGWLHANAGAPFHLFVHSWATHVPYSAPHRARAEWREGKRRAIERIQSDRAGALEQSQRGLPARRGVSVRAQHRRASSRRSRSSAFATPRPSSSRPTTASRGGSASTTSRRCGACTTCTGRGSGTRSSRCR